MFAIFVLAIYRVFPRFLMQSVDGVNLYFVLDKLLVWRSSPWEVGTVTPLESMTSTLWFPLNIHPTILDLQLLRRSDTAGLPDGLLRQPGRVWLEPVLPRGDGIPAAGCADCRVDFFHPGHAAGHNLFQGINNVQVMAWAYVCLGLLVYVGKRRSWTGGLLLLLFQLACVAYVLGDPVWHLTTLPVFGVVALAILIGAESARERWIKLASLAVALAIQSALQTYVFLFYTLADTARSILPNEYDLRRSASSAGYLFRGDTLAFVVGLLLILGLTIGHVEEFSLRPRLPRLLTAAAIGFYLLVSADGYAYLRFQQWPAFRPGYIVEMA